MEHVVCGTGHVLFDGPSPTTSAWACRDATDEEVETPARAAGAHEFSAGFLKGYRTPAGEAGGTPAASANTSPLPAPILKRYIVILDEACYADPESELW